ncbi:MAG: isocitrate/isopropylmalate family dehydrogenase, partial [Fidelibacterota bacterium]
MTKVAIIPGDGVGPEVMAEASKLMDTVTKAFHVDIEVVNFDLGADYYLETGLTLPEGVVAELSDGFRAILLGPLGDPRVQDDRHAKEILWGLVRELDLFAGLRHIKLLSLDLCPLANKTEQDIDLILVWEGL